MDMDGMKSDFGGFWDPSWEGKEEKMMMPTCSRGENSNPQNGRSAALLGCKPSFWGDTSERLVRMLRLLNGVKFIIIYVDKAENLLSEDISNQLLITENCNYFEK